MPPIQVRECPASTYEQLKEYAARHHRSMSQQILAFIEQGLMDESPAPRSKYEGELSPERVEERRKMFEELAKRPIRIDPPGAPNVVDMIREDRDSR